MELVAAAKLRRAQARIEAMRPYAERMEELMVGVARASSSVRGLPLLQRREVRTTAILPLTGDRGLAGAFNAQVVREAFAIERRLRDESVEPRWLVAGRKGASTLRFRRYEVEQAWSGFSDSPRYADAQAIAHRVSELFAEQEVDRVVVIYNHFESALTQRVVAQDVLPIPESLLQGGRRVIVAGAPRRLHLRARARADPRAAAAGLRRDRALPGAPRVGRLRAGRPDDGNAKRLQERRRADRPPRRCR